MFRTSLASLLLILVVACSPGNAPFKTTDVSQAGWGGDFILTAQDGKRVSSADFHGKVALIFFGYTHCPDICAPTLIKLAELRKSLGKDAPDVQVLFVTVDPGRDTPSQLASFVPRFDPSFLGLTGTQQEIAAVASDYKVAFRPSHAGHGNHAAPTIDHSGGVFAKDRKGRLRLYMAEGVSTQDMVSDVRRLLRER